eukprot:TRINITY_DN75654_c0_g1_i1.p1 TRINITY_DN75654_c0_g1~~TRINITY_DN75654_c0_g1_i1.p1  ORF type:complete len:217 (-),score=23.84 TRINITY_DN75654_c0_g1_i1:156-719(-)
METQLAGAMASLAVEASGKVRPDPLVVVDPACGMGTLLLAIARIWGEKHIHLIGVDVDTRKVDKCVANFATCGLDASGIRAGNACLERGGVGEVADGTAAAVLCDLPCGAAHKASADGKSYDAFLSEAARTLQPGGRCVLLSTRRRMLARAAAATGPWRLVGAWSVGRGEGNLRETQLIALERVCDS